MPMTFDPLGFVILTVALAAFGFAAGYLAGRQENKDKLRATRNQLQNCFNELDDLRTTMALHNVELPQAFVENGDDHAGLRGLGWVQSKAIIVECMAQAGYKKLYSEVQPMGVNIMHRVAQTAHKAGALQMLSICNTRLGVSSKAKSLERLDAMRWNAVVNAAGPWQDGSATSVRLYQDDATHTCMIIVGDQGQQRHTYYMERGSFNAAADALICEQQEHRYE